MDYRNSRNRETQAIETSRNCETRNRNTRHPEKFLEGFVYSKGFKGNAEFATGDYQIAYGQDTWTLKLS
jgi:hypothetical protein